MLQKHLTKCVPSHTAQLPIVDVHDSFSKAEKRQVLLLVGTPLIPVQLQLMLHSPRHDANIVPPPCPGGSRIPLVQASVGKYGQSVRSHEWCN